jgi:hypothetical protein
MRRVWVLALLIAMGLFAAVLTAEMQSHLNAFEPAVKTELKIPTDVIVGNCILKAGVYIVVCDREIVTFTLKSTNQRMAEFTCKGPVMKDTPKETRAVYEPQPSGYLALEKLYLKGNNIEHIF